MFNFHISFKNLIKTNRKGVGSISSIYFSFYIQYTSMDTTKISLLVFIQEEEKNIEIITTF